MKSNYRVTINTDNQDKDGTSVDIIIKKEGVHKFSCTFYGIKSKKYHNLLLSKLIDAITDFEQSAVMAWREENGQTGRVLLPDSQ